MVWFLNVELKPFLKKETNNCFWKHLYLVVMSYGRNNKKFPLHIQN